MSDAFRTLSPIDGRVVCERTWQGPAAVDRTLVRAVRAQQEWRRVPLAERKAKVAAMIDAVTARRTDLAREITLQMGRPIRYAAGEIDGFADRGHTMIRLADQALAPIDPGAKPGFTRTIEHVPVGVVLVLAPWNYPWLTAVNTVVPALVAGNAVVLKHSDQTPLVAERMSEAAAAAGLPDGLFQHLHITHELTAKVVRDPRVAFVAFTGSVEGGRAVHNALGGTFKAAGLELGGKDAGYVREDADLDFAIENLVDGAFFNSGQSCCGIERIYVHERHFKRFLDGVVELAKGYQLGDPLEEATTLGPVVRKRNAEAIQAQVDAAVAAGATAHVDPAAFAATAALGLPYLAPQVLSGVDHTMAVMREETFGPVVGVMSVPDDATALRLINDSPYGLTASIWTHDLDAAAALGRELEVGTVFANRCDALDPELGWVGVKDSGRGCTLSVLGYASLTRPRSFHLRHPRA